MRMRRRDQAGELAMVVEPCGHRLQLTADLVPGEPIEQAGLDRAFWRDRRLRCGGFVFWNQSVAEAAGPCSRKVAIPQIISRIYVCGRALASRAATHSCSSDCGKKNPQPWSSRCRDL
jgi:hypothetical protein